VSVCRAWRVREALSSWKTLDLRANMKDPAESVLYSDIDYMNIDAQKLAQTLRCAALESRDLARYIGSFNVSPDFDEEMNLQSANVFSEVLAAAHALRRLTIHNSDVALLAITIARQTCAKTLTCLSVRINNHTYAATLTHVGYLAQLHHLSLVFFDPNPLTGVLQLEDVERVSWKFINLHTLTVKIYDGSFAPVMAKLLGNSDMPSLKNMTFAMYDPNTGNAEGGQDFEQFFSRHALHHLYLDINPEAESTLVAVLPHIRTVSLAAPAINVAIVSHLHGTVVKLHLDEIGYHDDPGIWDGMDLLLEGGTGVQEVTTDDWPKNTDSWLDFLNLKTYYDADERSQLKRVKYANLLATKGIRFVDPQGKTLADYYTAG
jgi:hypothetical protein